MRRRFFGMAVFASAFLAVTHPNISASAIEVVSPAEVGLSAQRLNKITSLISHEVDTGRISGAVVAIARHGQIGYLEAIGERDAEADLPMQSDTLFRLASMTKAITSAAVLMLHEDGQLALADPVSKFLPEFKHLRVLASVEGPGVETVPADRELTIHDLLTHTSGLTYGWFGPEKLDAIYRQQTIPDLFVPITELIADRVERIATVPLKFQPGNHWDYSVSMDVLGRVIEVVSGLTLEQFFDERFFRPLKMQDTHFYISQKKLPRLAALYTPDNQQKIRRVTNQPVTAGFLTFSSDYCVAENGRFFSGGGGLVSTTTDYLRFLQMLLNGGQLNGTRVLERDTVALMTTNQIGSKQIPFPGHGDGFGYGFGVLTDCGTSSDAASAGSFSWGGVFNTYYWVDPQEQLIGVLMTQIFPHDHLEIRKQFKHLAYQAIDDSGFSRIYWYEKGNEHANPHFNGRQLRVNAPETSVYPAISTRTESQSSGMARILIKEELHKIRSATLTSEIWGGHPGTTQKRVSVNGRTLLALPEVGSAQHHCTHQYPSFNLRPMDLVNGYNSLQFGCEKGDASWGHYLVDNATLRIGLTRQDELLRQAKLTDFDVNIQAIPLDDGDGFTLQLKGTREQLAKISAVHYQGKYFGFDENGNTHRTDWHGMTKARKPYGMLGTSSKAPFQIVWKTRMLPAQQDAAVRAFVEFKDQLRTVYTTPTLAELEIEERETERVTLHGVNDLPTHLWSRAGQQKECAIALDMDPADIVAAELHVVAWTGGAGKIKNYFTLNGTHFPVAEGSNHTVVYSRLPIDPGLLRRGKNDIALLSDTEHHGIEIMRPGPMIVVRHRIPGTAAKVSMRERRSQPSTTSISQEAISQETTSQKTAKRRALEQFALTSKGKADAGREIFFDNRRTNCATCHRVQGKGGEVGPDLSKIGGKFDRPHLIESLLQPSQQIVEGFRTSVIVTEAGLVHSGVIKSRDEKSVVFVDSSNRRHTINLSSIEECTDTSVSIMPEGLVDVLSPQEFTDLLTYLETLQTGLQKQGSDVSGPIQITEGFEITTVATGISGATAIETLPDGRVLVCEQQGSLRVVEDGKLLPEPFVNLPVEKNWERGLIGVTVAPNFPDDPYVYVVYVANQPYPHHRVSRFRANGNVAVLGSEEIILRGDDQRKLGGNVPAGHQGGAIHFGMDGKLYIGIGEQTAGMPAQKFDTYQGKMLRINSDGSIPEDNPFIGQTTGKYQAIWAIGCRNPFTFATQKSTGIMFINDVGGKHEEINLGVAGANYGWPIADHGTTHESGLIGPIHIYPQASIVGGDFADANLAWPVQYRGRYFFADYVHGWIKSLDPASPATAMEFARGIRRLVDLRFSVDDSLYVLVRNAWVVDGKFQDGTGSLLRIRPKQEVH